MHGIHNGYDKKTINSYVGEIKKLFSKFNFKFILLDGLWKKYDINFDKINRILNQKNPGWWNKIKNRKSIEKNAENRNLFLDSQIAAQKYYVMRDLEKKMLMKEFKNHIFHAFADNKLRNVLPRMPTFYFYSRKGWSDAPWFVVRNK